MTLAALAILICVHSGRYWAVDAHFDPQRGCPSCPPCPRRHLGVSTTGPLCPPLLPVSPVLAPTGASPSNRITNTERRCSRRTLAALASGSLQCR
ncbi:hypothetical protein F4808DRAFT_426142 [Astrocystis sublimbata]|nr:hypothetical protein F4808DRAFT_426142 [Astrocystis sublimbata]